LSVSAAMLFTCAASCVFGRRRAGHAAVGRNTRRRAAIFRNGHIMFELDTITFMSLSLDSHFTIIPLISHFHVILIPPAPRSHLIRLAFISLPSHSHPIRILLSSRFHFAFLSLLSLSSHSNLTIISLSSHHALLRFFFWGWFG
jgi:hypothetical protein